MLVYFHYLDKNPRWVTDGYDDFPEEYQTCGQPVDAPVIWSFRERYSLYFCYIYVKTMSINRDEINTCDNTIHNLSAYVCD